MNPWSAEQRDWLQALGHSVFVLAGSEDEFDAEAVPAASAGPALGAVSHAAGSSRAPGHAAQPAREDTGRVQLARDAAFAPSRASGADPEPVAPNPRQPPAPANPAGFAGTPPGAGSEPVRAPSARGDVAARAAALSAALLSGIPQPVLATAADAEAIGRLRAELLRATGRGGRDAEAVLAALGIDAAALHANPAAKRAVWPRLRRQRRQAAP